MGRSTIVIELDSQHVDAMMHKGSSSQSATIGNRHSQNPSTHPPHLHSLVSRTRRGHGAATNRRVPSLPGKRQGTRVERQRAFLVGLDVRKSIDVLSL